MEQGNRDKAKAFLNNAGYGVGSNYSTGTVIDLMKSFFEAQQQINLNIGDVGVSVCATESHAMMKAGVLIKCHDCDEKFKETER